MIALAFALLAGILSVLSPCVLPLLPLVLGAAASEHRLGPAALALGLAISYTAIGLFIVTIGFDLGLDGDVMRRVVAVLLVLVGIVMILPTAQVRLATAAGPLSNWTEQTFGGFSTSGLWGQFCVGLLLGGVWSPCVGPTLGAATALAAQGNDLPHVAATMAVFGIGAALPLLLLGTVSRELMLRWRERMAGAASRVKVAFGVAMILIGGLVAAGLDKGLETRLVAMSPTWLSAVTTRF